jgi:thiamine pyrophosphate-dependent acetolactate synthase large subunit-like protein
MRGDFGEGNPWQFPMGQAAQPVLEDFLIVSGLAGTSRDIAALTRDGAHTYTMAGAMGGACMIGLGLALARPDRRVLVVTGDGELLTDPPAFKRNMDPSACRSRFRATLLGAA